MEFLQIATQKSLSLHPSGGTHFANKPQKKRGIFEKCPSKTHARYFLLGALREQTPKKVEF
jgi:hypothetical protein